MVGGDRDRDRDPALAVCCTDHAGCRCCVTSLLVCTFPFAPLCLPLSPCLRLCAYPSSPPASVTYYTVSLPSSSPNPAAETRRMWTFDLCLVVCNTNTNPNTKANPIRSGSIRPCPCLETAQDPNLDLDLLAPSPSCTLPTPVFYASPPPLPPPFPPPCGPPILPPSVFPQPSTPQQFQVTQNSTTQHPARG